MTFTFVFANFSSSLENESPASMNFEAATHHHNPTSYSSLRSKIKAMSSVTKQIKNKFGNHQVKSKDQSTTSSGASNASTSASSMTNSSKFRSTSHGALHSLNEFVNSNKRPENNSIEDNDSSDDINGIWSASQLASKTAKKAQPPSKNRRNEVRIIIDV